MRRTNESPIHASPRNRDNRLRLAGIAAAAWMCGCASPGPDRPEQGPLAPYDEREDAGAECSPHDDGGDVDVYAAGTSCDPTRFLPGAVAVDEPTYSLCACEDIDAANTITSQGAGAWSDDVGANTGWRSSSPVDLAGTLTSGASLQTDNTLAVDGLRVQDMLSGSSDVHVRGDATVGGMEFPQERVTVDGTLTAPAGAVLDGLVSSGDLVREDVDVEPPCRCEGGLPADDRIVAFADFDGDEPYPDALIGLSEPTTLYFGCADHAFSAIEANNTLTIVIVGHTRLWIDGDVEVAGPFEIQIEPGASLELFVGGRFAPTNTVTMGRAEEPAALRVWVREAVQLASPWRMSGSMYAPDADVVVNNTLELRGAIFGRRFEFSSPVTLLDGPRFTGDACVVGGDG